MPLVDLSGYSFSGKSAVYDLLQGQDIFDSISKYFEFELMRAPGGILELREAISGDNWSPIRSSEAIRRYLRLVWLLGGKGRFIDRLTRLGCHYDIFFPNFTKLSNQYVEKLLSTKWESMWPYEKYFHSDLKIVFEKLMSRFGYKNTPEIYLTRLEREEFDSYTKEYLNALLSSRNNLPGSILLLNNVFEPFRPAIGIGLVSNAKSIIVDRDPRDIYLSAWSSAVGAGSQAGKAVIGDSAHDFVKRFLIYRRAINTNEENANVFRLTFEGLVKNFESIRRNLCEFLELNDIDIDINKSDFDPTVSIDNVSMWEYQTDRDLLSSISFIEKELEDYLCIE
jgi:hypothetical protein